MISSDPLWDKFREQLPAANNWAYFDHAAVAPISKPAADIYQKWINQVTEGGVANWSFWKKQVEQTRKSAAQLLNAKTSEIALLHNTTAGINLVAEGFPWKPGDNVVIFSEEFPSNIFPWLRLKEKGVEVRTVHSKNEQWELAELKKICDRRTRIVAVSWVGYATGWKNDLAAIAEITHQAGGHLFVDAIQGLGTFPLDVAETPIDFLAADGHKWMLGPEGAGMFFIRDEHLGLIRPLTVGWNSVQQSGDFSNLDFDLKNSAAQFEAGTHNFGGLAAFGASLQLLLETGIERISERVIEITDLLAERLKSAGAEICSDRHQNRKSAILACQFPGHSPQNLKKRCRQQKVIVNCRAGKLRLSPHAYLNHDDLETLMAALPNVTD